MLGGGKASDGERPDRSDGYGSSRDKGKGKRKRGRYTENGWMDEQGHLHVPGGGRSRARTRSSRGARQQPLPNQLASAVVKMADTMSALVHQGRK